MNPTMRGGSSWTYLESVPRIHRDWGPPEFRHSDSGFRVAKHEGRHRATRGGSFLHGPICRSAYRLRDGTNNYFDTLGFRLARKKL